MTFHMEQTQLRRGLASSMLASDNIEMSAPGSGDQRARSAAQPTPGIGVELEVCTSSGIKSPIKRLPFPKRLWQVVNDENPMMTWTPDGEGVIIDEAHFEREVMVLYPGLVQIPTFANLRRQFRAYSFEWRLSGDRSDQIVFFHPYFKRDHPHLLSFVFTKRKHGNHLHDASQSGVDLLLGGSEPVRKRHYKRRQSINSAAKMSPMDDDDNDLTLIHTDDLGCSCDVPSQHSPPYRAEGTHRCSTGASTHMGGVETFQRNDNKMLMVDMQGNPVQFPGLSQHRKVRILGQAESVGLIPGHGPPVSSQTVYMTRVGAGAVGCGNPMCNNCQPSSPQQQWTRGRHPSPALVMGPCDPRVQQATPQPQPCAVAIRGPQVSRVVQKVSPRERVLYAMPAQHAPILPQQVLQGHTAAKVMYRHPSGEYLVPVPVPRRAALGADPAVSIGNHGPQQIITISRPGSPTHTENINVPTNSPVAVAVTSSDASPMLASPVAAQRLHGSVTPPPSRSEAGVPDKTYHNLENMEAHYREDPGGEGCGPRGMPGGHVGPAVLCIPQPDIVQNEAYHNFTASQRAANFEMRANTSTPPGAPAMVTPPPGHDTNNIQQQQHPHQLNPREPYIVDVVPQRAYIDQPVVHNVNIDKQVIQVPIEKTQVAPSNEHIFPSKTKPSQPHSLSMSDIKIPNIIPTSLSSTPTPELQLQSAMALGNKISQNNDITVISSGVAGDEINSSRQPKPVSSPTLLIANAPSKDQQQQQQRATSLSSGSPITMIRAKLSVNTSLVVSPKFKRPSLVANNVSLSPVQLSPRPQPGSLTPLLSPASKSRSFSASPRQQPKSLIGITRPQQQPRSLNANVLPALNPNISPRSLSSMYFKPIHHPNTKVSPHDHDGKIAGSNHQQPSFEVQYVHAPYPMHPVEATAAKSSEYVTNVDGHKDSAEDSIEKERGVQVNVKHVASSQNDPPTTNQSHVLQAISAGEKLIITCAETQEEICPIDKTPPYHMPLDQ